MPQIDHSIWKGITLCAVGIILLVTGILTLCKVIPWNKIIRFPNQDFPDSYKIRIGISSNVLGVVMIGMGRMLLIHREKQPLSEKKLPHQDLQNTQKNDDEQIKDNGEKESDLIAKPIPTEGNHALHNSKKEEDEVKDQFIKGKLSAEEVAKKVPSLAINLCQWCIDIKPSRYEDALIFVGKIPYAQRSEFLYKLLSTCLEAEGIDEAILKKIMKMIQQNNEIKEKCFQNLINPYAAKQVSAYKQNPQPEELRTLFMIAHFCNVDHRNQWFIAIAQHCFDKGNDEYLECIIEKMEGKVKDDWMKLVALHYLENQNRDKAITYCCKMNPEIQKAIFNQWLSPLLVEEKKQELLFILNLPWQRCKETVERIVMDFVQKILDDKMTAANLGEAQVLYHQFQPFFSYQQYKVLKKLLANYTARLNEENGLWAEAILKSIRKECPWECQGTFAPPLVHAYLEKNELQKALTVEGQFQRPYPQGGGYDIWLKNSQSTLYIAQYYLRYDENPVEKIKELSPTGAQALFTILIQNFLKKPDKELFKKIFSLCNAVSYNKNDLLLQICGVYKKETKIEDIVIFLSCVPLLNEQEMSYDRMFRKNLLMLLDEENIEDICQQIRAQNISRQLITTLMDHFLLQREGGIQHAINFLDAIPSEQRNFFIAPLYMVSDLKAYYYLFIHTFLQENSKEKEKYYQHQNDPQLVNYVETSISQFLKNNKKLFEEGKDERLRSNFWKELQRILPQFVEILKSL